MFSPEILFPRASLSVLFSSKKFSSFIKSPNNTSSLLLFGISIPKLVLPGCEEILAEREDMALAMSSDKPTTLLAFIPAFGINSKSVTIGPDLKFIIFPQHHTLTRYFRVLKILVDLAFEFLLFDFFL